MDTLDTTALTALLSGGAVAALIEAVTRFILFIKAKKAQKEGDEKELESILALSKTLDTEGRLESIEKKADALGEAVKYLLYDRIRHLGQSYIREGQVSFDERRLLHEMHSAYHNSLSGNGDLDTLMAEVDKLPLKVCE